ncbi:MAG: Na+/H+ antiporter subunit E [Lachnospiraceae bacterium]|nr:Na+/H+ antiporter subunit E [Lachnospiraceae bacterium]
MFLILFGVWLILNGKITAEICIFGIVISAALFYFICRFMDYSVKKELLLFRLIPLFVQYFWVLVKEIVKANVCVLKIILSPELQPEPALVYFDTDLRSQLSKVMLADSITLTPGTITVSVEENRFCVHCLDRELADGMEESVFVELLKKMEGLMFEEMLEQPGILKQAEGEESRWN